MQAPYNDRWERTKRYLLRNFLVNPGFRLSPIPEEDRSSPDSGSLPDLVVERLPDRHDHPPDYYDGLERRMRRYYRQLFLGINGSDNDDSSDFEVNRSMASTFMLENNARKYNEENILAEDNNTDSDPEVSIGKEKELNQSTKTDDGEITKAQDEDKLIETCATYDETGQASADSKLSVEGEEDMKLIESFSVHESNHSYESDIESNLITEVYKYSYEDANGDDESRLRKKDRPKSSYEIGGERQALNGEEVEIIETKTDSEGSAPCHRLSTTVAEVHEAGPRRTSSNEFDNGSPVLIPRLLQFSRIVFGSSVRNSGQSFNILEASDAFIKKLSRKHDELKNNDTEEQETPLRLLTTSELTRASLDSTTEAVQCLEAENNIQEDIDNEHNIGHEINEQPGDEEQVQTDSDLGKDSNDEKILRELKDNHDASEKNSDLDNESTETTGISEASIGWNKDGIDDDEDCFDNAIRRGVFASKARKMVILSSDEEIDNMVPIAHSSEKSFDEKEPELMRDARESGGNLSWHGEARQSSPASAFEAQTRFSDAGKIENESSASSEINASFEEMEETGENPHHTLISRKFATIINEFWSVSSVDFDFEELPKERSRKTDSGSASDKRKSLESGSNKRQTNSKNGSIEGETDSSCGSNKRKTVSKRRSDKRKASDSGSRKRQTDSGNGSHDEKTDPGSGSKKRKASESASNKSKTSESSSIKIKSSESGSNQEQTDSESGSTKSETESRSNKRQTSSDEDPSAKRMKKDIAIQTSSHETLKDWEDVRCDFFVGTPLLFRLCGCPDHVCP